MIKRGIIAWLMICTVFAEDHTVSKECRLTHGVKSVACVWGDFIWQLIDIDTLWVLGLATPIYLTARFLDKDIHRLFYCPNHHTNINQMPKWCYYTAKVGVPIELVAISFLGLSSRYDIAKSGQAFAFTLPITWALKKGLKQIKSDVCRRPLNQFFNPHKKYYKACPSGHAFEAFYAGTYGLLRFGWKAGLPLLSFAAVVSGELISCNRHFTSQIVAGSALGIAAGIAADKVAKRWIYTGSACDFSVSGGCINFSYSY
jgi:membrane-associated phospholipid phosphatase